MAIKKPASLNTPLREIRACTICAPVLPHAPRPVVAASADSRILIIGQAPGACMRRAFRGDLPPRPECAAHWRERVFAALNGAGLTHRVPAKQSEIRI